jgi:hypothetical protein
LRVAFVTHLQTLKPWIDLAVRGNRLENEWFRPGLLSEEIASKNAESVLYWSTQKNMGHSEVQTLRVAYHFSKKPQILQFVFTPEMSNLVALRFDITDRPAFCTLHVIRLLNEQGEKVWEWDKQSLVFSFLSEDIHVLPGNYTKPVLHIFSSGFDPHVQLNLPTEILAQAFAGWTLIIEVTIQLPNFGLPFVLRSLDRHDNKDLSSLNIQEGTLSSELAKVLELLQIRLVRNEHTTAQQNAKIQQLNGAHHKLCNELIRAEAQLELLKDLLLNSNSGQF